VAYPASGVRKEAQGLDHGKQFLMVLAKGRK